jgi:acetyl-CoA acetyltransferase
MAERTLRGKTAIAGIGETIYYKHGQSPDSEFKLALQAIVKACEDAGISPHDIDGFASYGNDRSDGPRLAAALGIKELRFSNMFWGGGGGGVCGAVGNASAAVATGMADCVVAFRSLAQGQYARYGRGNAAVAAGGDDAFLFPYGVMSPAQRFAMKVTRFMHETGIKQEALRAISLACYHHAQNNPNAVMRGRTLDEAKYDASRWIIEPFFHLYDCCRAGGKGQGFAAQANLRARLRPGLRSPQRGAGAQHAQLPEFAFSPDRAKALRHGEIEARRYGDRAVLRKLHGWRADESDRA